MGVHDGAAAAGTKQRRSFRSPTEKTTASAEQRGRLALSAAFAYAAVLQQASEERTAHCSTTTTQTAQPPPVDAIAIGGRCPLNYTSQSIATSFLLDSLSIYQLCKNVWVNFLSVYYK